MRVDLRYLGHSGVREIASGVALAFAPNLARPKVFFDGELVHPLRFREAISALHAVVIGDLRFKKKDKRAYLAYKAREDQKLADLEKALFEHEKQEELARIAKEPIPRGLEVDFARLHRVYWTARRQWAAELSRNDPELFRHLVPCDPVVTVAPDVVFFECFAKDESSYGCLSVQRDAFRSGDDAGLGTTNVDYSLALYENFQTLRTYRPTRLQVDPSGFEVKVENKSGYREEKIDLPPSWLRGFGQLQAAMALPARRVELSVDVVYSVLAYLARHREKAGPRSIRFQLTPGKPPVVFLDPWGIAIPSRGKPYEGDKAEEIKVWGRRRLFPLARALPLVEGFEVLLFGSGLPSVWTASMGEMRFTLALSGWTANDWTSGTNLDQHFAHFQSDPSVVEALARHLEVARVASTAQLRGEVQAPEKVLLGSLHALARLGQVAFDFSASVYRWRPIMPVALSEAVLGPESPEVVAGKRLAERVSITRDESLPGGRRLLVSKVEETSCEGAIDVDGSFSRAKCSCSFFHRSRLRAGPCRHLIALRIRALGLTPTAPSARTPDAISLPQAKVPPVFPPVRPPAGVQAAARRGQVFHLTGDTLAAIGIEAERRRATAHDIVERAWRIARTRIQECPSQDDLQRLMGPLGGGAKAPQTFQIDPHLLDEMQAEAARLDVSVSAVFDAAWSVAKATMQLTSSLIPPTGGG